MNCEQVQQLLPLLVSDDLDDNESKAVKSHCQSCSVCQKMADAWIQDMAALTSGLLSESEPQPNDTALNAAVEAAVLRQESRLIQPRWWSRRMASAMAAALVFMILGHFIASNLSEDPPSLVVDSKPLVGWNDLQDFFDDCLTPPVPVDQWQAAEEPGVLAILVRRRGDDQYEVAASLEVADMARLQSYPWLAQRLRKLQLEAGQDGELVITSCDTGHLNRAERRRLQRNFKAEFGG